MITRKTPPYPGPSELIFKGSIRHPDLLLWDSWIVNVDGDIHLYCLALSRRDHDGTPIRPGHANNYFFHFRHFVSDDRGASWRDKGIALNPGNLEDGSDAANVWSGGVMELEDSRILFGYTGISAPTPDQQFVQSICFATGPADGPDTFMTCAASHPIRDRDAIIKAGYYLPEPSEIGHNEGEANGPITAWRDPCMFTDEVGRIHALWSAKVGPREPAVAHAIVHADGLDIDIELLPPITLPDADEYTQAEVPKICKNPVDKTYYMLISACNRLHEMQPDEEIFKQLRLYKSSSLGGPWKPYKPDTTILQNMDNLFGASFLQREFKNNVIDLLAPYTVYAGRALELTFAPIQKVHL